MYHKLKHKRTSVNQSTSYGCINIYVFWSPMKSLRLSIATLKHSSVFHK